MWIPSCLAGQQRPASWQSLYSPDQRAAPASVREENTSLAEHRTSSQSFPAPGGNQPSHQRSGTAHVFDYGGMQKRKSKHSPEHESALDLWGEQLPNMFRQISLQSRGFLCAKYQKVDFRQHINSLEYLIKDKSIVIIILLIFYYCFTVPIQ